MFKRFRLRNILSKAILQFIINRITNAFQMLSIHLNSKYNCVFQSVNNPSDIGMRFEMSSFTNHYHVINTQCFVTACQYNKRLIGSLKSVSFG
jgi:hypothetical protein